MKNNYFISSLKLRNFRKHKNVNFNFNKNIIFFIGYNAIGKTSILESIYIIGLSKSNRTLNDEEVISFNEEFSLIDLKENNANYKIIISKKGKSLSINKIEFKKSSEYIGNLNVLFSSKEDLNLINGSPGDRRMFLNLELGVIDKDYLTKLKKYNEILKERNVFLKNNNLDLNYLNVLDEDLILLGKEIVFKRNDFINKFNLILKEIYINLFDKEEVIINYKPSLFNNYESLFYEKRDFDKQTQITNFGPHRDDFIILLDNKEANRFASEGQKKMIIIIIKLALSRYIEKIKNITPILLLDDLFSDLDQIRQNKIINFLNNNQTFITTTSIKNIEEGLLKKSQIFIFEQGVWKEK